MLKRTTINFVNDTFSKNANWKILDIGCGYRAHKRASVIADVQDFSNESVTSQAGQKGYPKKSKRDIGTVARARAGEGTVTVDTSDGVSILAYPKPEFNVGFSLDGRSRNPGAGRFKNKDKI